MPSSSLTAMRAMIGKGRRGEVHHHHTTMVMMHIHVLRLHAVKWGMWRVIKRAHKMKDHSMADAHFFMEHTLSSQMMD